MNPSCRRCGEYNYPEEIINGRCHLCGSLLEDEIEV